MDHFCAAVFCSLLDCWGENLRQRDDGQSTEANFWFRSKPRLDAQFSLSSLTGATCARSLGWLPLVAGRARCPSVRKLLGHRPSRPLDIGKAHGTSVVLAVRRWSRAGHQAVATGPYGCAGSRLWHRLGHDGHSTWAPLVAGVGPAIEDRLDLDRKPSARHCGSALVVATIHTG